MPLKLNVGLSKKIGQPDFGSLGLSCHVEVALDGSLNDLDSFHRHVRNAYIACHKAVADELSRHEPPPAQGHNGNGSHATSSNGSGNRSEYQASDKQLNYARRLASQIQGLGKVDSLVTRMFDKPMSDLTGFEASSLIDQLKAIKDGTIRLDEIPDGVPS
jgi:hypothetical protein